MTERQKSLALLAFLASLIVIGLIFSTVLLLKSPPDDSMWFIRQPGITWTAKGRPVVSGSTCTFIEYHGGKTFVISGLFEIEEVGK